MDSQSCVLPAVNGFTSEKTWADHCQAHLDGPEGFQLIAILLAMAGIWPPLDTVLGV